MAPVRECRDILDTRDTNSIRACLAPARCHTRGWLTDTGCPIRACQVPGATRQEVRVCRGLVTKL